MRIAMVGTRGVPAAYGGFETAVEEIGHRLVSRGHEVIVYCRGDKRPPFTYRGMKLVHCRALHIKALETLSHTAASVRDLQRNPVDVAVIFNAANAPFVRRVQARGTRVAVHVDGLEWQRGKWGSIGRRYYLRAEAQAVRDADRLVTDSRAVDAYYAARYGAETTYIPYGADVSSDRPSARLAEVGLRPRAYHLVVARFEPENNVLMVVDGYSRSRAELPLAVVGGAPYGASYTHLIASRAQADPRIHMLGYVYDQDLLDQLYSHARSYIHGHSVGGTNPSLLRAMAAGVPLAAFDVSFNREVAGETARYFSTDEKLARLIDQAEREGATIAATLGRAAQQRVARHYQWDDVADRYERLCTELVLSRVRHPRRSTVAGPVVAVLAPFSRLTPALRREGDR